MLLQQTLGVVLPTALDDPDEFDITNELLANADPAVLSRADDVLTFRLTNGVRRYRMAYQNQRGDWHVVRIERG